MRPHTIDKETIERLRKLVAAMYGGRDELYTAADMRLAECLVCLRPTRGISASCVPEDSAVPRDRESGSGNCHPAATRFGHSAAS